MRRGGGDPGFLRQQNTMRDALIAAMAEEPKLIERPVVITAKGARIGRPPESVLEVL